jgi:hypothetical protein
MGLVKLICISLIAYYSKDKLLELLRYFNKYDFIKNNKYLNIDNYISDGIIIIIIIGFLVLIT